MVDWLLDAGETVLRILLHPFMLLVLCVVVIFACIEWQSRAIDGECARMMMLARTNRDTLDVRIACSRLHSDANTATAISIGAGIVAGSNAARVK
jgi:hypothetical protein